MPFMPRQAGDEPKVKLNKEITRKLKRLTKITRRTISAEVHIAVEQYLAGNRQWEGRE